MCMVAFARIRRLLVVARGRYLPRSPEPPVPGLMVLTLATTALSNWAMASSGRARRSTRIEEEWARCIASREPDQMPHR